MTLPWAPETSAERCTRCHKSLRETLGQDSTTGWVHMHLSCLHCGTEVRERPMPHRTQTVLTVAEIIRRRTAHLDHGEVVQRWIGTMSGAELDELAERGEN
jgi:hypothetical protein